MFASLLLTLGACGDGARETPTPAPARDERGIALPDASLKFLTIEPAGESVAGAGASIPGRLRIRPQAVSSLGAPTTGRVVSVLVHPGEAVSAGQVLLTLQSADAAGARAMLEQASARTAAAEEALRRHNEMVAKGVGLEMERFEAEVRSREARAELERARRAVVLDATRSRYDIEQIRVDLTASLAESQVRLLALLGELDRLGAAR